MQTNFYVDAFNLYYGAPEGDAAPLAGPASALRARCSPATRSTASGTSRRCVESRPSDVHRPSPSGRRTCAPCRRSRTSRSTSASTRPEPIQLPLATPPKMGPKTARVLRTEEKGSDVNLASYLLLDAFRRRLRDSDRGFKRRRPEGADRDGVKDELGIPVGVLNPHPPKRQSRDLAARHSSSSCATDRSPRASSRTILADARGEIRKPSSLVGGASFEIAEARSSGPRTQPPRRLGGMGRKNTTLWPADQACWSWRRVGISQCSAMPRRVAMLLRHEPAAASRESWSAPPATCVSSAPTAR